MADPTIMDALNEALDEHAGIEPGAESTDEEVIVEGGEEGADEGGDEGAEEGAEEGDGADGEGDADEPSEEPTLEELGAEAEKLGISVRDGGKFKSKEQLQKEIVAAQAAADKTPKLGKDGKPLPVEKPKKEADPLNDPIDKSLKVETQQRIRTLIDRTKAAEEGRQAAQTNFDTIIKGVQSTGTTPEQYGETLSFLKKLNSGDPAQQASALEEIESLADRLATMLGKERTISDPLAMHADLLTAVKAGQVTRQLAMETARLRNGTTMRTTMQTQQQQHDQQLQQIEAEKVQGKSDLNTLEGELRRRDGAAYDRKLAIILPAVKVALSRVRPAEWKQEFTRIYNEVKIGFPARKPIVKGQQPNRANKSGGAGGGGSAKGGETQPKDMMDALNQALAKGRG